VFLLGGGVACWLCCCILFVGGGVRGCAKRKEGKKGACLYFYILQGVSIRRECESDRRASVIIPNSESGGVRRQEEEEEGEEKGGVPMCCRRLPPPPFPTNQKIRTRMVTLRVTDRASIACLVARAGGPPLLFRFACFST
jgi:hypothetical protein